MNQPILSRATNVIHLINGEQYSGLERVIDQLAEWAPDYGYQFHLVCLKSAEIRDHINTRNAQIYHVPMRSRVDLSGIAKICDIARKKQCKLIISHTVRSAVVARILQGRLAIPWLHHVHSPARYESENICLNYINYFVEKVVLPSADKLLPVSVSLGRYVHLEYRIPKNKIKVIPNGVSIASTSGEQHRTQGDAFTLGMVGLMRHRKGVGTLIHSIGLLAAQGLRLQLKLIGAFVSNDYKNRIQDLIRELNLTAYINICGFSRNVLQDLEKVDIFIMPSLYGEGMPMALLEAMSVGKIIIASNVEGISEVVEHGITGLLIEPGNPNALADAIRTIMSDYKYGNKLGNGARDRQRDHFSLGTMASRVFCAYDQ